MIDWTKPCETTDTPPRPVRVLFGDDQKAEAAVIGGELYWIEFEGSRAWRQEFPDDDYVFITLRNTPAKPVRHEGWLNLYVDGGACMHPSLGSSQNASDYFEAARLAERRHIVWSPDGSPVDQTARDSLEWGELTSELQRTVNALDATTLECAEWRTKAEALKAEVDQEKRNVLTLVKTVARQEEAARSHAQWLDRTRPVVDAAVAGVDSFNRRGLLRLIEAVRAYQNAGPATSDGHEVVAEDTLDSLREILRAAAYDPEPLGMKNCKTCRHYPSDHDGTCYAEVGACGGYEHWEAKP